MPLPAARQPAFSRALPSTAAVLPAEPRRFGFKAGAAPLAALPPRAGVAKIVTPRAGAFSGADSQGGKEAKPDAGGKIASNGKSDSAAARPQPLAPFAAPALTSVATPAKALIHARLPQLSRFAIAWLGSLSLADYVVQKAIAEVLRDARFLWKDDRLLLVLLTRLYAIGAAYADAEPADGRAFDAWLLARVHGADEAELKELAEAMRLIPAEDRAVLLLLALEDLRYVELAEVLGIPADLAARRVARARQRLHEMLAIDNLTDQMQ